MTRLLTLIFLMFASPLLAQTAPETFTMNLRDADIRALSEQVSQITGRTLVLDPAVAGTVTVISSQPLDKDGVWELYQSVLGGQGFAAMASGNIWRVVPLASIKEGAGAFTGTPGRLDVVTALIPLHNFPAETAVGALRPLVASFGYIEAVVDTNTLVITDTAENVNRIKTIAEQLDAGNGMQTYTFHLQLADATEVGTAIASVLGTPQGALGPRVTVNAGANLLLLTSDVATHAMVEKLVAEMDVPGRKQATTTLVTRVYALNFADAAALTGVLRGLVGDASAPQPEATNPVAAALQNQSQQGQPPPATDANGQPVADTTVPQPAYSTGPSASGITIAASVDTNSIVVRAPEKDQADIAALIRQLDQRRPQVLIEAAIVEVSGDISEELGIQLGFGKATPPGGFAASSFAPNGPTLKNILTLLQVPAAGSLAEGGLTAGLAQGDNFGLLLQALGASNKANLLSTPSITTLDNQPAEIIVGQNVPFRTGSFATDGNTATPFTTIERKDVGITMRVVPRVNKGDVVQLEITQEVSSLVNKTVSGAADLITNTRSIKTTVLADNGGTIVLGGLITDDRQLSRTGVPGLQDVPVLGGLFRAHNNARNKRTLFVFLRPTILRSRSDIAVVANDRFLRLNAIDANTAGVLPPLGQPTANHGTAPAPARAPQYVPTPAPKPRVIKRSQVEIPGVY